MSKVCAHYGIPICDLLHAIPHILCSDETMESEEEMNMPTYDNLATEQNPCFKG